VAVTVGQSSVVELGEIYAAYRKFMPPIAKRSTSQAVKPGPSARDVPLPQFVPPQLSLPVEKPPTGPQWVHEIKLDGFRMAARIDNGRLQLLTRTGLDWTAKYPVPTADRDSPRLRPQLKASKPATLGEARVFTPKQLSK
jgi:bifunctional non-homologous end joining protein LigD